MCVPYGLSVRDADPGCVFACACLSLGLSAERVYACLAQTNCTAKPPCFQLGSLTGTLYFIHGQRCKSKMAKSVGRKHQIESQQVEGVEPARVGTVCKKTGQHAAKGVCILA